MGDNGSTDYSFTAFPFDGWQWQYRLQFTFNVSCRYDSNDTDTVTVPLQISDPDNPTSSLESNGHTMTEWDSTASLPLRTTCVCNSQTNWSSRQKYPRFTHGLIFLTKLAQLQLTHLRSHWSVIVQPRRSFGPGLGLDIYFSKLANSRTKSVRVSYKNTIGYQKTMF